MNIKFILLIPLILIFNTSCSTFKDKSNIKDQDRLSKETASIGMKNEHGLKKVPNWFLEPPKSNAKIFAASSGVSSTLQLAIDKAILNSKYALASQIRNRISGKSQSFSMEEGFTKNSVRHTQTKTVKREFLKEVNVGGYYVEKKAIHNEDGLFYAYVLLSYQLENSPSLNNLNSNNELKNTKKLADKEFKNLEDSIRIEVLPLQQ